MGVQGYCPFNTISINANQAHETPTTTTRKPHKTKQKKKNTHTEA